jgi:hypothetical protein
MKNRQKGLKHIHVLSATLEAAAISTDCAHHFAPRKAPNKVKALRYMTYALSGDLAHKLIPFGVHNKGQLAKSSESNGTYYYNSAFGMPGTLQNGKRRLIRKTRKTKSAYYAQKPFPYQASSSRGQAFKPTVVVQKQTPGRMPHRRAA